MRTITTYLSHETHPDHIVHMSAATLRIITRALEMTYPLDTRFASISTIIRLLQIAEEKQDNA